MQPPPRVIKIGGSLLDLSDLPRRLSAWRDRQPPTLDVLVAGGGSFAEAVRQADRVHGLGDQAAHSLAIASLSLSARLLASLLPEATVAGRFSDLTAAAWASPAVPCPSRIQAPVILDLGSCWQDAQSQRELARLPVSWDVTSDSLAAATARALGASELVLLKSASPPPRELSELAAAGFVDRYFPQAAAGLTVRLVNLRSADLAERTFHLALAGRQ